MGKTSVIEAIQMVTALKSFRTSHYNQMVRWGDEHAAVDAHLAGSGRSLDIRLNIEAGKRSYRLNGKPKRLQDLKGLLPAVAFSPDDLGLAKGPNSARRDAIDDIGVQLSKNFFTVKRDYTKLIRQKNRALKDEMPDEFIDSIDDLLVRVGVQLMSHRMVVLEKMRPSFQDFYREITAGKEILDFAYAPSWAVCADEDGNVSRGTPSPNAFIDENTFNREEAIDQLGKALRNARGQERARKTSVMGPHADRIAFYLDGHNALHYSSQGQQRSIVLAFKLAEVAVIQETLHQKPLLLLDDVMSELDEKRRTFFMNFISGDIQTFITATDESFFNDLLREAALLVRLSNREGENE